MTQIFLSMPLGRKPNFSREWMMIPLKWRSNIRFIFLFPFQEMDEITDQFRTEDAEEFKQLQAELEVAGSFDPSRLTYALLIF